MANVIVYFPVVVAATAKLKMVQLQARSDRLFLVQCRGA